ncbi:MAG: hypothetical protein GVY22_15800 [Gammaproteobacteria bacterium]|jgi:uncharacterized protein involved in exopolysaccharide biosynthesis|nr:hypothetical protein [Gammaproteobacteria bacterium]
MPGRGHDLVGSDQNVDWKRNPPQSGEGDGRLPQIEVVTREGSEERPSKRRSTGSLVVWFLAAFALVAIPASIWNFSRPPVYRAAAMVLTIVPEARSGYGASEANLQHVAIQRSVLLSRRLLEDTLARLRRDPTQAPAVEDNPRETSEQSRAEHRTAGSRSAALDPLSAHVTSGTGTGDAVLVSDAADAASQSNPPAPGSTTPTDASVDSAPSVEELTADDLLTMLAVDPVPQTNLVELSARGGDPALLARIVNEWLAAYEILREREIEAQVGDRLEKLEDRARRLEDRIKAKRDALDAFRERFDIVTLGRDSNEAVERLSSLQEQLSQAEEAVAAARAERDRIESAIAAGRPVIPEQLEDRLSRLRQQAEQARARVLRLRERYTDFFIEKDLNKRRVVDQFEQLEQEVAAMERQGSDEALQSAREAVDVARRRVEELQQALTAQKARASRFSSGFAEFEALKEDLAQLESMQREVESERVSLETTVYADYPQIEVIDAAFTPRDPIEPDYGRDLMVTLIAATALGLLTVIVLTWLDAGARRRRSSTPVTGVRIWGSDGQRSEDSPSDSQLPRQTRYQALGRDAAGSADPPSLLGAAESAPRQLTVGEIEALWQLADTAERQLIGLLLSGVQLDEARALTHEDFDLAARQLQLQSAAQPDGTRTLTLPPRLLECLQGAEPLPLWEGQEADRFDDLMHRISLLAADAGIAHADEIDGQALHDTYVIYLVRQGARLTRLNEVAGPMSGAEARRFAPYAPPGASRPFEELELTHPALT